MNHLTEAETWSSQPITLNGTSKPYLTATKLQYKNVQQQFKKLLTHTKLNLIFISMVLPSLHHPARKWGGPIIQHSGPARDFKISSSSSSSSNSSISSTPHLKNGYVYYASHNTHVAIAYLCQTTVEFILLKFWPPNSPDINPVDYTIWCCLQDQVYHKHVFNVHELKLHLLEVWLDFGQTIVDEAIANWKNNFRLASSPHKGTVPRIFVVNLM